MRSRTKLLTADQPADHVWLTALEAQMAEHGAALALARRDTVAALGEALEQQLDGPFARPRLSLDGWDDPAGDLSGMFTQGRRRAAPAGGPLAGPQQTHPSPPPPH